MRYLLVGAGIGQINLAKKIKERGHYLIVIAYNSIPEVTNLADKFVHQDLFLYEEVLAIAREEGVDAVVSDQHDIMAPLVAYLAEKLKLPGNKYSTVAAYCNKNTFRAICDSIGVPTPKHAKVTTPIIPEILTNVPFPWIVKPADSQSSVGVMRVNNVDECINAIKAALPFSKSHEAIVEEFFVGREVVAEGFVKDGQYFNMGIADRKYFALENLFIPSQTIFPSTINNEILSQIIRYEQEITYKMSPSFGIVHSEYLYNSETKEVRIVESGLRGGGVYISSHLIPLYCNIDINNLLLDCAEGKDINMELVMRKRREQASAYVCFYLKPGIITSIINKDKIAMMSEMLCLDNVFINTIAPPITHKGQRLGPIILQAENRQKIECKIRDVQNSLIITTNKSGYDSAIVWI